MVKKKSAGILVFRRKFNEPEVLFAHPGGPFWAKKDLGAWSIPKGEYEDDEDPLAAAKREFQEEIGLPVPAGELFDLGEIVRKDKKVIKVWAVEGDLDVSHIESNLFEMEWPPHSGQYQQFPEIDRAQWFLLSEASPKLHAGQEIFIARLAAVLTQC